MFNDQNLDGAKVIVVEATLLCFGPREAGLVELEDVCEQLEFLWPEEIVAIEFQVLQPFHSEAWARQELRWTSGECREREKRVLGDVVDCAEVLREQGRHGANFASHLFVGGNGDWWG